MKRPPAEAGGRSLEEAVTSAVRLAGHPVQAGRASAPAAGSADRASAGHHHLADHRAGRLAGRLAGSSGPDLDCSGSWLPLNV
jgi:hypothetical protein